MPNLTLGLEPRPVEPWVPTIDIVKLIDYSSLLIIIIKRGHFLLLEYIAIFGVWVVSTPGKLIMVILPVYAYYGYSIGV